MRVSKGFKMTENKLEIVSSWLFILALILLYMLISHFNFLMTVAVERSPLELWFNTINTGVWSFIFSVAIYKTYMKISSTEWN
jgi:hypothetical protein